MSSYKNAHILLVEDDSIDKEMVLRSFKKSNINNPLVCVRDGVEALEALKGEQGRDKIPQPCIVLLDINTPRMNGFQLMRVMREDPFLRNNVVFMLTTSAGSSDRRLAYDLHAAGYFLKQDTADFVKLLSQYCKLNVFPARPPENYANSV